MQVRTVSFEIVIITSGVHSYTHTDTQGKKKAAKHAAPFHATHVDRLAHIKVHSGLKAVVDIGLVVMR